MQASVGAHIKEAIQWCEEMGDIPPICAAFNVMYLKNPDD